MASLYFDANVMTERALLHFVWRDDKPPFYRSRKILMVAITRARYHTMMVQQVWPECPIMRGYSLDSPSMLRRRLVRRIAPRVAIGEAFKPVGWQNKSGAKRQHITGREDGQNRLLASFQKQWFPSHFVAVTTDVTIIWIPVPHGRSFLAALRTDSSLTLQFFPHCSELRERRELRYWPRKVLVERVVRFC